MSTAVLLGPDFPSRLRFVETALSPLNTELRSRAVYIELSSANGYLIFRLSVASVDPLNCSLHFELTLHLEHTGSFRYGGYHTILEYSE